MVIILGEAQFTRLVLLRLTPATYVGLLRQSSLSS